MSAPAGGGRAYTLTPGRNGVLLTEYAGAGDDASVLIINTSLTDRAWLAAAGNVGPSTGVPLDPGTAIPWTNPGQVWAVADPAAAAPITLIATTAISDWTPSPVAIATEVAAKLLATGVPNVLVEDVVVNGQQFAGSVSFDVSEYASLALRAFKAVGDLDLTLQWLTDTPTPEIVDQEFIYCPDALTASALVRLAVSAATLQITSNSGTAQIWISGSNRPPLKRIDARSETADGGRWAFTGAIAAGTDQPLTPDSNAKLTGLATAAFKNTGTGTGRFDLVTLTHTITVCDTAEMITNAHGAKYLCRQIMLPESSGWSLQFHAETAQAAGTVSVDLVVGG